MHPILIVTLVCASAVKTPDCTRETALDVIVGPAYTLQECLVQGSVMAASAGQGDRRETYVKTRCEPRR